MSSDVWFRRNAVRVRDGDLVVILRFLLGNVGGGSEDSWHDLVRQTWQERIQPTGFGCYDLDLDQLVYDEARKSQMIRILKDTRESFLAQGRVLSAEYLNGLVPRGYTYLSDVGTEFFVEILDRFIALVQGGETWHRLAAKGDIAATGQTGSEEE